MTESFFHSQAGSGILYSVAVLAIALISSTLINKAFAALSRRFKLAAFRSDGLRQTIHYALLAIAALIILNEFGFDTHTILTVIGTVLGLIAIGFVAVWSILSNFLCTLIILTFKPFRVGDSISIPGDSVGGKVVEVSLTFTILEAEDGSRIHVPNNIFFQKIFVQKKNP